MVFLSIFDFGTFLIPHFQPETPRVLRESFVRLDPSGHDLPGIRSVLRGFVVVKPVDAMNFIHSNPITFLKILEYPIVV